MLAAQMAPHRVNGRGPTQEIDPPMQDAPYAGRFWAKVDKAGPVPEHRPDLGSCWLWTAAVQNRGYGTFSPHHVTRKHALAHRVAYELVVGPIPDGLQLDHLCRVVRCVNPAHLEPVTNRENAHRGQGLGGVNIAKTHCVRGHEYSAENTYYYPNGHRRCNECHRQYERDRARRLAREKREGVR